MSETLFCVLWGIFLTGICFLLVGWNPFAPLLACILWCSTAFCYWTVVDIANNIVRAKVYPLIIV